MRHRLVIARWDEDVAWAKAYPHIIYDKGGAPLDMTGLNVVILPTNPEGHESHTYLQHIISHYNDLDDWTTFVQGHPFDHANEWDQQWNAEPETGFAMVGHWIVRDGFDGAPHHPRPIPVGAAYEAIFGRPGPVEYVFIAGAQFVASRDLIRSKPLEFYERVQALGFEPRFEPDWGYTMERLWSYILNEAIG